MWKRGSKPALNWQLVVIFLRPPFGIFFLEMSSFLPSSRCCDKRFLRLVDLATLSTDVEGDAITYSVVSSSTADAIGTIDDSNLTVSFEGVGSATLTVTASANGTSDELDVSVAVNAFTKQVHITSFTAGDPLKTGQIFRVPTTFAGMEVPADYTIVEAGSNILERLSLDILNSEWVYEVKANPSLDEEVIVFQGLTENRLAITVAVADWTVSESNGCALHLP